MSLISVIIPVYNGEKTILETIESVLNQTFSDLELIIVNDGSQDATLEIVSSIQDPRIKIFSYANAGVSASRNRGFLQAAGEFIAFLDADDLWTADKLEAQFEALQENRQAAVAYSWTDYINESSQFLYSGSHTTITGDVYGKLLVHNFLENGSNPLIRREALIETGGFDESLFGPEDWELLLRLAARYHFVAIPRPQVLYRISDNSISANISRQETECLKVIERAFAQAPDSLQYLKRYSIANLYRYLTYKVLAGPLGNQKGKLAARCFWHSVRNNPSWLCQHPKLMLIVSVKIAAAIILPSQLAQALLSNIKNVNRSSPT